MDASNRATLVSTLERLGAPDDATALEAAREAHRLVSEAGLSWDELIWEEDEEDEEDDVPALAAEPSPATPADSPAAPPAPGDDARLVERLLARKELSPEMREELEGFRADIAAGRLEPMDQRYLHGLAKRLGA